MKDWIICPSCDEEFKIITDSVVSAPIYCPFCSEELDDDLEDEEDDE
jgi:uncharacterized Zn-finger protein